MRRANAFSRFGPRRDRLALVTVGLRALVCAGVLLLAGFEWEGRAARLHQDLQSRDEDTRIEAVRQLARLSGSDVDDALVGALGDASFDVRFEVARACRVRRLAACAPGLREWLEGADPDARAMALRSLGAVGTAEDVPRLGRALGDARATVRRAAVEGLAELDEPSALGPLVRALDDSDPIVRTTAATALGARAVSASALPPTSAADRAAAVTALLGRTRDDAPEVRVVALEALGAFGDPRSVGAALLALADDVEDVRLAALALLARVPSAAANAALGELAAEDGRIGRAAVAALARTPSDAAIDALVTALGRPPVSRAAEEALAERASVDETERVRVVTRLAAQIDEARAGAPLAVLARAAGHIAEHASIAELSSSLLSSLGRGTEPSVLEALGATGSEAALVPLLAALGSEDASIRVAALGGLEAWTRIRTPDGRMLDPIAAAIPLLADDQRARAIGLVARVPGERADAILVVALRDPARGARLAALCALRERERSVAEDLLVGLLDDSDAEIRAHAALALARSAGAATAEVLARRVAGDDAVDRQAVLTALGPIALRLRAEGGHDETLGRVRAAFLLALDAEDPGLADAAAFAVAASEDASMAPELAARLAGAGPSERARLARALGPLDHERAREALRELARGDDPVAATVALAQLGETGGPVEAAALLEQAGTLRFPASAAASFALARFAARGVLDRSAVAALCALAGSHDPHVRANVAVALARLSITECADGPTPLAWLAPSAPPLVRFAAVRWAGAVGSAQESAATARVLADCARDVTQPTIARACASPSMPDGVEDADVVAYGLTGHRLASRLVALLFDDGSVLVTYADSVGHVRLARAPRGPMTLHAPESAPLMR